MPDATTEVSARPPPDPGLSAKEDPPPLRSVHTSNFSAILQDLGISLLVTTYQAGKLVMLRPDGDHLNTHFRGFGKPMGLAVDGDRLAIGTSVVKFEDALQEIFAVAVLPGVRHPDVINDQARVIRDSFVVPDDALGFVPGPLRQIARVTTALSLTEEILR
jgi:hypothetical protein